MARTIEEERRKRFPWAGRETSEVAVYGLELLPRHRFACMTFQCAGLESIMLLAPVLPSDLKSLCKGHSKIMEFTLSRCLNAQTLRCLKASIWFPSSSYNNRLVGSASRECWNWKMPLLLKIRLAEETSHVEEAQLMVCRPCFCQTWEIRL
ncbi:hypothetical protein SELMODRAFT_445336 [Selaginella moellendorffii]|uniref:Uncharacterized protein n=1 Tax=Selaginella moellendorffii TaxID=88036 RepID=D8SHU0_SELML|nr:hypothetical protein SELMODRAFT_445336 [Selaginella moellendorffii]